MAKEITFDIESTEIKAQDMIDDAVITNFPTSPAAE